MTRQLFWFGVVGVTAMLVHLGSVALILVPLGLTPLLANILGFLVAFQVSHSGHRHFTFRDQESPAASSRGRFFVVALLSFAVNEVLYWLLLRYTTLDYRVALAMVLVAVAALTFVLARYWAFASGEPA
jgi:putative flippase GtrA